MPIDLVPRDPLIDTCCNLADMAPRPLRTTVPRQRVRRQMPKGYGQRGPGSVAGQDAIDKLLHRRHEPVGIERVLGEPEC